MLIDARKMWPSPCRDNSCITTAAETADGRQEHSTGSTRVRLRAFGHKSHIFRTVTGSRSSPNFECKTNFDRRMP